MLHRNPSRYPGQVKNGRSEGLNRWVDNFVDTINGELTQNQQKLFENLTVDQRSSLKTLASDPTITIKPADKGGALVVLDTLGYEKACKEVLSNKDLY